MDTVNPGMGTGRERDPEGKNSSEACERDGPAAAEIFRFWIFEFEGCHGGPEFNDSMSRMVWVWGRHGEVFIGG